MRTDFYLRAAAAGLALGMAALQTVCADNRIYGYATPGGQFAYVVTNMPANTVYPGNCPALNLTAGATYQLIVGTASFHPLVIATNNTASPPSASAYSGASPQAVFSGPITVTLPASNFPPVLYYRCNIHGFNGRIDILPPPSPRQIDSVSVTNLVVLMSTGVSNTWTLVPEFSSNLVDGVWAPVSSFTNSFVNGTNATTTFDRLDAICGGNVFIRLRQSPP